MNNILLPHYDVIIIGAGSIGAPAAFYLVNAGLKVLVIDSVPSVGQGSNKKAIGGIRATHSDPAKVRLCLRSIDIFKTWKETYGDDIEWYQGGYCFVAYREKEEQALKNVAVQQRELGLNIQWLDHQQLLQIVPDLNPINLLGGTFSPEDGNASPLLATHAFYTHAQQKGAQFHFNEQVLEIITRSGKVSGVKTDCAVYATDIVINAAGAYASEIGKMVQIDIPVKPELARIGDHGRCHALSRSDDCGYPPNPGVVKFLLLPALHRSNRLLYHTQSANMGD